MVERQYRECQRPRLGEQIVPPGGLGERVVIAARIGHVHRVLEVRESGADPGHVGPAIDRALAIAVAGDRQQHLRLDHLETGDHAARTELRCAGSPHGADAGGCEERDQRLRDVGQVGDDAVARADPQPQEPGAGARDLLTKLTETELDWLTRLRVGTHRDTAGVLVAADRVFGVVQGRTGKPPCTGHLEVAQDLLVGRVRPELEEVPERAPEPLEVGNRPSPQLRVPG